MSRRLDARALASLLAALATVAAAREAAAQATPLPDSVTIGAFTFRPLVEVRVRGEYQRSPVDVGGDTYETTAVLEQAPGSTLPSHGTGMAPVVDHVQVAERSRLGLTVEGGPVTGVFTMQDARAFVNAWPLNAAPGELPSSLAPVEAYVDLHTRSGRPMSLRIGRQRVTWGDGRLLGEDDWSKAGRSLDAIRASIAVGDVDIQALGALFAGTGLAYVQWNTNTVRAPVPAFAELFGLDVTWRFLPLLNVELTGLARLTQDSPPMGFAPADTYVGDARFFGDYRGFRYAVEGAYELGHTTVEKPEPEPQSPPTRVDVPLGAFAVAARAGLETALPLHLTFEAEAAYASGDKGTPAGQIAPAKLTRFDPIMPDTHTSLSPMNMFAWSNIFTVGGDVRMKFVDELGLMVGYRFASLASARDRWSTAELVPVGAVSAAQLPASNTLGHEVDAALKLSPFRGLDFEGGYGLFLFGDAGRAILGEASRPATMSHWAYLQATFHAP